MSRTLLAFLFLAAAFVAGCEFLVPGLAPLELGVPDLIPEQVDAGGVDLLAGDSASAPLPDLVGDGAIVADLTPVADLAPLPGDAAADLSVALADLTVAGDVPLPDLSSPAIDFRNAGSEAGIDLAGPAPPDMAKSPDLASLPLPDLAVPPAADLARPPDLVSPPPAADFKSFPDLGPSCSDKVKNGKETDVDCGGGTCPACVPPGKCGVAADCGDNAVCEAGLCSWRMGAFFESGQAARSVCWLNRQYKPIGSPVNLPGEGIVANAPPEAYAGKTYTLPGCQGGNTRQAIFRGTNCGPVNAATIHDGVGNSVGEGGDALCQQN